MEGDVVLPGIAAAVSNLAQLGWLPLSVHHLGRVVLLRMFGTCQVPKGDLQSCLMKPVTALVPKTVQTLLGLVSSS